MTLGLVIPVHNDQSALWRLLDCVAGLGVFDQIVIVDDGSTPVLELPERAADGMTLLRNETARGPGPARNIGLDAITTSHVLFFDSDDLLTADFAPLWRELAGQDFDFCLFRHADSRGFAVGDWGQMDLDEALWQQAGLVGTALSEVSNRSAVLLAQTANYPWNKIYRTEFLRSAQIRFPDLPVHEDVAPHWHSFAGAERILASTRVAAIHYVATDAHRQTNRRGRERLAVFDTLTAVWDSLQDPGARDLRLSFLRFADTLLDWVHGVIEPDYRPDVMQRSGAMLAGILTPALVDQLIARDPVLAHRLLLRMTVEPAPC